ncbi:hypothetical protein CKM354_000062600 [Cercospora kikuchii]|uniref:Major facilitator superfamily (MFS) profile domain-containing protein n=1 Tax=Cercospora kikuchii TaxID=84275 RepID=A0A9P3CEC1_9PEZI|nr:uncharacterized protein CKM354_000062600 [Cercospora kikuchii]GIZ37168.1 hypothetical protein CKM354_000062600 [Cercospora kikuchii]
MAVLNFRKRERSDFPRRTDSDDSASDRKDEKVDEDLSGEHVERQDPDVQQQASVLASIDPAKEKRLVRKIDRWLIPLVMLLYLMSFIDRVNLGNARLYGLEEDLGMNQETGYEFSVAITVLFPTYVAFELPSNLVMKHYVRPSRWIAFITISWGFVATFSGFTQTYGGLLACRVLLGLTEAGLFPGLVIYLTLFYTRQEIALRTGYLFVSAAVSGSVAGLLAYGIGFMDGLAGMSGWRWILIIQGLPTIILGLYCIWGLADDADTAFFLNEEERALVKARRAAQGTTNEFDWADFRLGMKDWKTYVFSLTQFCGNVSHYAYATFLPTIIREIFPDASTAIVQLYTVPCYATGAISYLIVAWFSDRTQLRGPFASVFAFISATGYAILVGAGLTGTGPGVLYFGCFVAAAGIYVILGLNIAWLNTNNPRYGKRATASGMQIMLGNIPGVISPWLYTNSDAPLYTKGHSVNVALVALAGVVHGFMFFYFTWENKQRSMGKRDYKIEGKTEEEIAEMADESPRFRFTR